MRNLIFVLYVLVALGLVAMSGALDSGFAGFLDEPSHLVTGLMVHDYLLSMNLTDPLGYAKNYYLHYPKVGIGQWPPLFYLIQGLWYLMFGVDRITLLILMSVLSAVIAVIIYRTLRTECGEFLAVLGGLIFLMLPLVQQLTGSVMTEVPLTLFCFIAVLQFGRFVDDRRNYHLLLFTLFSVLALMTKGNAIAIAFVPTLIVVITKRWDLLSVKALWLSAIVVILVCAPWYIATLDMVQGAWVGKGGLRLSYILKASQFYGKNLVGLGGVGMTCLVILGFITKIKNSKRSGVWSSLAGWIMGLLIVHLLVPSSIESRHLILLAPVWVIGFILGIHWLISNISVPKIRKFIIFPLLAVSLFVVEGFAVPTKNFHGYKQVSKDLLADPELEQSVILIVADVRGEGLFISELALMESHRPSHVVLRSSKVLAHSDWLGGNYRSQFESTEQLNDYLMRVPVGIVVLDNSSENEFEYTHYKLLRDTMEKNKAIWKERSRHDVIRNGKHYSDAMLVYQLEGHQKIPKKAIQVKQVLDKEYRELSIIESIFGKESKNE